MYTCARMHSGIGEPRVDQGSNAARLAAHFPATKCAGHTTVARPSIRILFRISWGTSHYAYIPAIESARTRARVASGLQDKRACLHVLLAELRLVHNKTGGENVSRHCMAAAAVISIIHVLSQLLLPAQRSLHTSREPYSPQGPPLISQNELATRHPHRKLQIPSHTAPRSRSSS
jgi:hypothetical protein